MTEKPTVEWPPPNSIDPDEATCDLCGGLEAWLSHSTKKQGGWDVHCVHCDPPLVWQEFMRPKPRRLRIWKST
jgi:hypothetical protein